MQAPIQHHDGLSYDEHKAMLTFDYRLAQDGFVMVNALLKQPIFEIRTISLAEAEQIPHAPFEVQ